MDIAKTILEVYILGGLIAGSITLHPDWQVSFDHVYKEKASKMQDRWALGSWYTVIRYQRKWIVKEIKHIIKKRK